MCEMLQINGRYTIEFADMSLENIIMSIPWVANLFDKKNHSQLIFVVTSATMFVTIWANSTIRRATLQRMTLSNA
uniref:Uncharacterized protein n=1 Tax=Oryza meridionalis TaxID=40149 RepID=A0A0E0EVS6_9ORYZ